jgi:hypothetical protein
MKPSGKRPNTRLRPTPAGAIVDPARAETRTSLLPMSPTDAANPFGNTIFVMGPVSNDPKSRVTPH